MRLLFGFFIFLCFLLFIGLWRRTWQTEFFLGGRQAGGVLIAGSLLATCFGGSATLGVVSKAYEIGWAAFWWLGSGSIGLILLGFFWVKTMRAAGLARTLPEWMGYHYGKPARLMAGCLIAVMWIGVIASQFVAMGTVLQILGGTGGLWPILVGGIVVTTYVVAGGLRSVLRTDLLQCLVLAFGLALPALFLSRLPVLETVVLEGPAGVALPSDLHPLQWLALVTVVGGMYIVGPDLCSRVLAARDTRNARQAAWIAAGGLFIGALVFTSAGVALHESSTPLNNAQQALPWLIQHTLPDVLAVTANLGLVAALLSSADTCLLTAASVLEIDVIGIKHRASSSRQAVFARMIAVLVAACSILLACINPRIIANIMMAYALYAGGLLMPLLFTVFQTRSLPLQRTTIWTAMAVGTLVPLVLLLTHSIHTPDFFLTLACAGFAGAGCNLAIIAGGLIHAIIKNSRSS